MAKDFLFGPARRVVWRIAGASPDATDVFGAAIFLIAGFYIASDGFMSLNRKLFSNGVASAGSIFWSAIAQVMTVPVLTHFWGVNTFGIWLMITTIPTYFALSDLGFSTAAASDMTMAHARGERDNVVKTFQSVWVLLLLISAGLLVLTSPLAFLPLLHLKSNSVWVQHGLTIFIMIAYGAAVLCSRVVLAGYRAIGHFSTGTFIYDFIQFLEVAGLMVVAVCGGNMALAGSVMLLVRLVNMLVMAIVLHFIAPWLKLGFRFAHRQELRRLLKPAMSAMVLPSVMALNLQGITLITGLVVSPLAVAVLGPVRTISRIAIQLVGIVNRATIPEFSAAYGKDDVHALKRIILLNALSILFILLPGAIIFCIFGPWVVKFWSNGKIIANQPFVALMAAGMFTQGVWFFASNLLQAINRLGGFVRILAPVVIFAMLLALPLGHYFGLNGIALAILVGELGSAAGAFVSVIEIAKTGVFKDIRHSITGLKHAE